MIINYLEYLHFIATTRSEYAATELRSILNK
jgi:hypothetical protein